MSISYKSLILKIYQITHFIKVESEILIIYD